MGALKRGTLLTLAALFFGCNPDKPEPETPNTEVNSKVWVLNEGNFQWGNASVGLWAVEEQKYYPKQFEAQNGKGVGDVLHSSTVINGQLVLVLNNTGKLVFVDPQTLKEIKTIDGFISPRYVLQDINNPNKAWVSDLYADKIYLLDLNSNTVIGEIPMGTNTEKMIQKGSRLFVEERYENSVFVIEDDQLVDSVNVEGELYDLLEWNEKILAFSTTTKGAMITCISSTTLEIEYTYLFEDYPSPECLIVKDELFLAFEGVLSCNLNALPLKFDRILSLSEEDYYGFNYQENIGYLYLSDAHDYVQNATVFIIDPRAKVVVNQFTAGAITTDFVFVKE